ncbi:MAG: RICIN domain-containing protein [Anaerolineae bacterium]|nr:RICIN domain-containing protein [Anaerolineae bacterium]MCB0190341.1 RICIN domain-containing protein [Anaerolineae bacterium]
MVNRQLLTVFIVLITVGAVMALLPPAPAYAQGRGTVIEVRHSRGCLDIRNESRRDRARAQQYFCHGRRNQQWLPIPASKSRILLVNGRSGKCLDVRGDAKRNYATVQQFSCHGGRNQQWYPVRVSSRDVLLVNRRSGKCLDVRGASLRPRAPVRQYACHAQSNQRWRFR